MLHAQVKGKNTWGKKEYPKSVLTPAPINNWRDISKEMKLQNNKKKSAAINLDGLDFPKKRQF